MKKRLFAFLCVLVILISAMSFASAGGDRIVISTGVKDRGYLNSNSYRTVKNGETVSFYVFAGPYQLFEKSGDHYNSFNDIVYDVAGKVKATTNVDWITISETTPGFDFSIQQNDTMKTRTGKITVSAKGYKATLKFTQLGCDAITSAVRNKNKVTLKFKFGDRKVHYLYVNRYKSTDKTYTSETIFRGPITKKSYTFKVKKGWSYSFGIGPAIKNVYDWGTDYNYDSTAWYSFKVESVTGTQVLTPWSYLK